MSEERRAEVLRRSRTVLAEHGYRNTTTRLLAAELGITAGTLYHYVESKQALLAAVCDQVREPMRQVLAETLASDAPAVERLRGLARAHARVVCDDPLGVWLMLTELDALEPGSRAAAAAELRAYRKAVERLVADGQADGDVRDDVGPALLTQLLLGALNWSVRWFDAAGPGPAEAVGDAAVTIVTVRGVTPGGGRFAPLRARA